MRSSRWWVLAICLGVAFFSFGPVFAAEVTEKQDIALFGLTYGSKDLSGRDIDYIDSSLNNVFVSFKRFNVLGYGKYRLETGDIDEFVERIREIRARKAVEEGTYDEKFGTVVIKGEDFDRIVNSFLVVVPSLSNYNVTKERKEILEGTSIFITVSYQVDVTIDVSFVNVREGVQEESIRITGSGSDLDIDRARIEAIDSAVSSLRLRVRQSDLFKIRSGVIQVSGDTVLFELGSDIGVKPGDEYQVLTKVQIGNTGRTTMIPTGMVRVKNVYPDVTEARIVYQKERITEGDQLAEWAKQGINLSLYTGVMKVDIPDMDYDILFVDDNDTAPYTEFYAAGFEQKERDLVPIVGISFAKTLGYRWRALVDITAMLNFPMFGIIGEPGIGIEFYKRRTTFGLTAQAGVLYVSSARKDMRRQGSFDDLEIEDVLIDADQDPKMSVNGFGGGLKGAAALSYRMSPSFSINTGIAYRLYTPIKNWNVHIEETVGGDKDEVTIASDSPNIIENAQSEGLKEINISGYEVTLEFLFRF